MKTKHVNIELTRTCNQRCFYCSNPDRDRVELDYTEWLRIIKDTNATSVHLTGGEPLLYKDLINLINELHSLDINISILTNGSVPKLLKNNKGVFQKLKTIQVSLDSVNSDTHDRRRGFSGAHDKALDTILFCRDTTIETHVSMVVDYSTVSGIDEMVVFCKENGLKLVLRPLAILGRSNTCFSDTLQIDTTDIVIPDKFGYGAKSFGNHIQQLTLSPEGNSVSY